MKLYEALCNAGFREEVTPLYTEERGQSSNIGRYVRLYDCTTETQRSRMKDNEVTRAITKFLTKKDHHNRCEHHFMEDYISEFIQLQSKD